MDRFEKIANNLYVDYRFALHYKNISKKIAKDMQSAKILVEDMDNEVRINSAIKKPAQKDLQKFLKQTYFKEIPLDEIFDIVTEHGLVPIDIDGTPWNGMLVGKKGRAFLRLAIKDGKNWKVVKNSGLVLTWYDMSDARKDKSYEVIGYLS